MTEDLKQQTQSLKDLIEEITFELNAFSDNVTALNDTPEKEVHARYCRHLDYIQDLLDRAEATSRGIKLTRDTPELYAVLLLQKQLRENGAIFGSVRGSFFKNYPMREEQSEDLERLPPEHHPGIEEPVSEPEPELPEEDLALLDQEVLLEEALLAVEMEAKRKKKKIKQKKHLQQAEEEVRLQRQAEASALGIHRDDRKEYTEAELTAERLRQWEDQQRVTAEIKARAEAEQEILKKYRAREEAAAQHQNLGKGHIDFSHDFSSAHSKQEEQGATTFDPISVPAAQSEGLRHMVPNDTEPVKHVSNHLNPDVSSVSEPETLKRDHQSARQDIPSSPVFPEISRINDPHPSLQDAAPDIQSYDPWHIPDRPAPKEESLSSSPNDPYHQQAAEGSEHHGTEMSDRKEGRESSQYASECRHEPFPAPPIVPNIRYEPGHAASQQLSQQLHAPEYHVEGRPRPFRYRNAEVHVPKDSTSYNFAPHTPKQEETQQRQPIPSTAPKPQHPDEMKSELHTPKPSPFHQTVKPDVPHPKDEDVRVHHTFVPGGVREVRHYDVRNRESGSNEAIYSVIRKGMNASEGRPVSVSSAYIEQAEWNVHMARLDYQSKRGTDAALDAVRHYQAQRKVLNALRADIHSGKVTVDRPEVSPVDFKANSTRAKDFIPPYNSQYNYVPNGTTGCTLDAKGNIIGNFQHNIREIRQHFRYTPENPMKVAPAYEAALEQRLTRATAAMDTAVRMKGEAPPKISAEATRELRLVQDAYAAYKKAKQAGVVVVAEDAKLTVPDFRAWQQRNQAGIFGTTVTPKSINLNKVQKESVEERSASILGKKSRLKRRYAYQYYLQSLGYRTSNYALNASSYISRRLYALIQDGEDNALRTFETGRYYTVTSIHVARAVYYRNIVNPDKLVQKLSVKERRRFGAYVDKDAKTVSREIRDKIKLGKERKAEIKAMFSRGTQLTKQERKELAVKLGKHTMLSAELRREVGYQKYHISKTEQIRIAKELKKEGAFSSVEKLRSNITKTRKDGDALLAKRYGKLTAFTDKSLAKEITLLTKQSKTLKGQIALLQAKGSALSAPQRKMLLQLRNQKKVIDRKLRSMIGLQQARKSLDAEIKLKNTFLTRMYKNKNAMYNGLFAFQGFILRPLQESADYGSQGLSRGIRIATNRHLHILLRRSFKAAARIVPQTALFLVTGDLHTAQNMVNMGQRAVKSFVTGVKTSAQLEAEAARKATKQALSALGRASKKAATKTVSSITPKPVKRGVHYVVDETRRQFAVAAAVRKRVFQKFWASKTGTVIGSVYRAGSNTAHAVKAVFSVVKALVSKVLVGVLLFFAVLIVIQAGAAVIGGTGSSVIMSPEESSQEKINLAPYYNILLDEWNEYMTALNKKGDKAGYYKTTVEMNAKPGNVREMLSMMTVRMSQDLDLSKNSKIEPYLRTLLRDANPYETSTYKTQCETKDCSTKKVQTDHKEDCPEDCTETHYKEVQYCPGNHKCVIYTVSSLSFDEIFYADSLGTENHTIVQQGLIADDFEITYYLPTGNRTASGTVPKAGRTIAVDKDVIPLGSRVSINGHIYVAEDTGGAVKGHIIDIFVDKESDIPSIGRHHNVAVYWAGYGGEGIEESGEWDSWNQTNREWARNIYSMPWNELYTGIPNVTDVVGNETSLDGVEFIDGEREASDAIVNIAMSQLGVEGGQPYWSWYGFPYRVEWCATFVSWCANQTGVLGTAIPKFASCSQQGVPWFIKHQQWASRGDTTPVAGDIIFFDWEQDGRPDHVGIVVGSDGTKVYTVEGNSRDMVRTKSYSLNSKLIFGYGLPNY